MNTRRLLFIKILAFDMFMLFMPMGNILYAKNFINSSKDIAKYEKRILRYVRIHDRKNTNYMAHMTTFFCSYTGFLSTDSVLSDSFLSNIQMCYGRFPRKRLLLGNTQIISKDTTYILHYTNYGKKINLNKYHADIVFFRNEIDEMLAWQRWNILYGIYIAYNDWPWDLIRKILIDKDGKTYYYDKTKKDCIIIDEEWADSLVEKWRAQEKWENEVMEVDM